MAKIAQKVLDQKKRIKEQVRNYQEYWADNVKRYHLCRNFVFKTSLSPDDISRLEDLKKPQMEFNILEAYVSRLRGEFSKQEPAFEIASADGAPPDSAQVAVIEGHLRSILYEANKNNFEYDIYTDLLSGGFSVGKVWTEYLNDGSFNQVIRNGRVFDPTLTGFDPLAKESHKGDGEFCYELFPLTKEEFQRLNPNINIDQIKFTRTFDGFNWSYNDGKKDIILVCDFYEKKYKSGKLLYLANNQTVTPKQYEMILKNHELMAEQAPVVVKSRYTDYQTTCRYRLIDSQIIDYLEMDYKFLPLVFFDGNSIMLRDTPQSASKQYTRAYVHNAIDAQRFKNFAGICFANELENMTANKLMIAEESVLPQYLDAILEPQKPNNIIYKAFKEGMGGEVIPLPAPIPIMRPPMPPEIIQAFEISNSTVQNILGSYDAALGINNNQLSGVALVEGATQSNAAAMPYVTGFLQGLNQMAMVNLDLIPKYLKTARTIPVHDNTGKRTFARVNQPQGVTLNYDSNSLMVNVTAGVNFSVQKSKALQQLIGLAQAMPIFGQFMNTVGLEVLIDNLEIYGVDRLKEMAQGFMKQQQQMQQAQAQQGNPMIQLKQQELQMQDQHHQDEMVIEAAKIQNDQQKLELQQYGIESDAAQNKADNTVQVIKAGVEAKKNDRIQDLAAEDQAHRHAKEFIETVTNGGKDNGSKKMDTKSDKETGSSS